VIGVRLPGRIRQLAE